MPATTWNCQFHDQSKVGKWALHMYGIASLGVDLVPRSARGSVLLPRHHLLLFTKSGMGDLGESDSGKMSPGLLTILPAGTGYDLSAATQWELLWFQLEATSDWTTLMPGRPTLSPASSLKVIEIISRIFRAEDKFLDQKQNRSFFEVYAQMLGSLLRLELTFAGFSSEETDGRLERLWRKVQSDAVYPWTIQKLASLSGFSRSHLQATVRRTYGCGAMEMVARIRMKISMKLLQDPQIKVADVAERVGYQSPFSFSKAFKRIVGMTPGDYRRQT